MPKNIEDVRAALQAEEPDYDRLVQELGEDAIPALAQLVAGESPLLASKAAYLAGRIGTDAAVPVVRRAAASADASVRVAAAAAAANLRSESASDVLVSLVDDSDLGVQKVALRAVPENASDVLRWRVEALSASGKVDARVKKASDAALRRFSKRD